MTRRGARGRLVAAVATCLLTLSFLPSSVALAGSEDEVPGTTGWEEWERSNHWDEADWSEVEHMLTLYAADWLAQAADLVADLPERGPKLHLHFSEDGLLTGIDAVEASEEPEFDTVFELVIRRSPPRVVRRAGTAVLERQQFPQLCTRIPPADDAATPGPTVWNLVEVVLRARVTGWLSEAAALTEGGLPERGPRIRLNFNEEGTLVEVELLEGSGSPVFDAALQLVLLRSSFDEVDSAGTMVIEPQGLPEEATDQPISAPAVAQQPPGAGRSPAAAPTPWPEPIRDRWTPEALPRANELFRLGRTSLGLGIGGLAAGMGMVGTAAALSTRTGIDPAAVPMLATAGGLLLVIGAATFPLGLEATRRMRRPDGQLPASRSPYLNRFYWTARTMQYTGAALVGGAGGALTTCLMTLFLQPGALALAIVYGVAALASGAVGVAFLVQGTRRMRRLQERQQESSGLPGPRLQTSPTTALGMAWDLPGRR